MDLNFLRNIWLRARWQTERLGTPGKAGFALIVFSGVFFVAAVLPRQAESHALMVEYEAMQARSRAEPAQISGGKGGGKSGQTLRKILPGDQALPAFYAFFPKLDSSPSWIGELVQVAKERGVEITGSDYRMVRETDLRLARYEMMLPIRGNYSQLRGFIADALRVVPAMALVDVAIRREAAESEVLEANVKFNLYLSEGKN